MSEGVFYKIDPLKKEKLDYLKEASLFFIHIVKSE